MKNRIGKYNKHYYTGNHLSSTQLVTDGTGVAVQQVEYAPFGEVVNEYNIDWSSGQVPDFKFNAKELDEESGMYYFEARYQSPPVFISRDVLFEKYPTSSPYAYCANNPVKYVDMTGEENVIYMVLLKGSNQAMAKKIMNKANERLKALGLNTKVVISSEGSKFNPAYMDKTDSYVAYGNVDAVKDFVKTNNPADYEHHFSTWQGNIDGNPEQSSNTMGQKTNVIGLDANGLAQTAEKYNTSEENMGAFLILHGAGHNASLNHTDAPNSREEGQSIYNCAIMESGNRVLLGGTFIHGLDERYFGKKYNSMYIDIMKKFFWNEPSKDNYLLNKQRSKLPYRCIYNE